jgi:hypothetical protein
MISPGLLEYGAAFALTPSSGFSTTGGAELQELASQLGSRALELANGLRLSTIATMIGPAWQRLNVATSMVTASARCYYDLLLHIERYMISTTK